MKKIQLKIPAKINLTLDVTGRTSDNYHQLQSLVASIDLYDSLTIKKRKDFNVDLKMKGIDPQCSTFENNAYKTAKTFENTYNTFGVSIVIDKQIPVGAGLGGSSADVAGVLNGMQKLFEVDDSVTLIADSMGSDSSYMLKGGWAILNGRGDKQEFLHFDFKLYLIILTMDKSVSAKQSYEEFDRQNIMYNHCTETAIMALKKGDFDLFCMSAKNDLYRATEHIVPEIKDNIKALKDAGAPLAIMTGSGTAVLGVFDNKKDRDKVYKKLKGVYGTKILRAQTI